MKGALLFGLLWWRRREFDGVIDGIVYAELVAAGFAFTENILYFGRAFVPGGLASEQGGVLIVFVLRGLLSPFAHPRLVFVPVQRTRSNMGVWSGSRSQSSASTPLRFWRA